MSAVGWILVIVMVVAVGRQWVEMRQQERKITAKASETPKTEATRIVTDTELVQWAKELREAAFEVGYQAGKANAIYRMEKRSIRIGHVSQKGYEVWTHTMTEECQVKEIGVKAKLAANVIPMPAESEVVIAENHEAEPPEWAV